jgi:transcriptional regulator with XRE-family HTH domain
MTTMIQVAMEAAGLGMPEFSRAVGTHPSNLYRLRAGKTPAGPRVRARVAQTLGCPVEELFAPDGWPLESESAHV